MSKQNFTLLVLVLLIHGLKAQEPRAPQHKTITYNGPPCNQDYQLVFEEEFSDQTINLDNWAIPPSENNHAPELMENPWQIWNDRSALTASFAENVFVRGGNLVLKACRQPEWYQHYVEYPTGLRSNLGYYDEDKQSWETLRASWKGTKVVSNHHSASSSNPFGCFEYGKFCIRAKVAKTRNNIWNAFWFFGAAGEIDMFEIYKNDDYLRSNMHLMGSIYACDDGMNNGRLTSYYDAWDIISGKIDPEESNCTLLKNIQNSNRHDLGDLSTKFHNYCLEWTPFKVVWSVDGQVIRTHYQYWYDSGRAWNIAGAYECLEVGKEYTLYEDMWFPRDQYINMILSIAGNGDPGTPYCDEMLIDYVKVWQMREAVELEVNGGTNVDCIEGNEEFEIEAVSNTPFGFYDWEVSSNLEIIANNGNSIRVRALAQTYGSQEWVEVRLPNEESCHDIVRRYDFWINPNTTNGVYLNQEYQPCSRSAKLRIAGPSTDILDYRIISATATSNHPGSRVDVQNAGQFINIDLYSQEKVDFINYEVVVKNISTGCERELTLRGSLVMYRCEGYYMKCENDEEIAIFPNPSSGLINVSFDAFGQDVLTDETFLGQEFQIISGESGQLMDIHQVGNSLGAPLDLQHYPNGVYYITSEICEEQVPKAFIIEK